MARIALEPPATANVKFTRRRMQEQYTHLLIGAGDGTGAAQLAKAGGRLEALLARYSPSGETLGLLGSAA